MNNKTESLRHELHDIMGEFEALKIRLFHVIRVLELSLEEDSDLIVQKDDKK